MGFVFTKFMSPIWWVLRLPSNRGSMKEDPRQYFIRRLALLEKAEQDDHRAALALACDRPLPKQTKAQLEMSEASFAELLEKFLVADAVAEGPPSEARASRPNSCFKTGDVECVICRDAFEAISCFKGPCGHCICSACVIAMAEVANKNEDIFPLQCCQQPLPMDTFLSFLQDPLRTRFSARCAEVATPPNLRVYCAVKSCSTFIGRKPASPQRVMSCPECHADVCSQCKKPAHPGESCDDNEARGVRALAKEKDWKTCPMCKMIVERSEGCPHMKCRCRQQFCYTCGGKWGEDCRCVRR